MERWVVSFRRIVNESNSEEEEVEVEGTIVLFGGRDDKSHALGSSAVRALRQAVSVRCREALRLNICMKCLTVIIGLR